LGVVCFQALVARLGKFCNRNLGIYPMTTTFIATARGTQGTGASRRLRHAGRTPGIVYGSNTAALNIELDHNNLWHALKKEDFHSSILTMTYEGAEQPVLLRDVQYHPFRPMVLHIDFQRVDPNKKIHMKVPLHFSGAEDSPAVKVGKAIVTHVVNELEVSCLPKDLPQFINVDLSNLQINASLHVKDIALPAGVTPVTGRQANPVLVTAVVPREEAEATAAPSAADVPASAQKAPVAGAPAAKTAAKTAKKK
jgi:large subunit ribosomal protein L25